MFHFSQCVNPQQVRCAAYLLRPSSGSPEPSGTDMQDFYIWQMPEHDTAIQLNLAQSRQEVKCQNNKQHLVTFQNKTFCVDTSTQISQKTQTQALLILQEHFVLLFLITQTYNCGHEWLCDYRGNSSASWAICLQYCAWRRTTGQNRIEVDTYPVEIGGERGVFTVSKRSHHQWSTDGTIHNDRKKQSH